MAQNPTEINQIANDKQHLQIISIIDYLLEQNSNSPDNTIISHDELNELKQELIQNNGSSLNPVQLNTTILMLLDYVIQNLNSL